MLTIIKIKTNFFINIALTLFYHFDNKKYKYHEYSKKNTSRNYASIKSR